MVINKKESDILVGKIALKRRDQQICGPSSTITAFIFLLGPTLFPVQLKSSSFLLRKSAAEWSYPLSLIWRQGQGTDGRYLHVTGTWWQLSWHNMLMITVIIIICITYCHSYVIYVVDIYIYRVIQKEEKINRKSPGYATRKLLRLLLQTGRLLLQTGRLLLQTSRLLLQNGRPQYRLQISFAFKKSV